MSEMPKPVRFDSAEIYDEAILRLREQMWVALLVITFLAQVITRLLRYLSGVKAAPLAITIQVTIYLVIIVGLLLRKSRHATTMQFLYQLCMHLALPFIILTYGGTRGMGDLALFICILVAMLYGLRRWMVMSFAISTIAFAYSLYLEIIGQPLNPLFEDVARFSALKLVFYLILVSFTLYMGQRFYSQLLKKHQRFADEQIQLTAELEQSAAQLEQRNTELQASRLKIVTAREEERRRLRHDLQEHLGPTLASLGYRAGAARRALHKRPENATALLNDLEGNLKDTLGDVRSFVYALHPPILDQLGLIGAINEHVRRLGVPFAIDLTLPDQLDSVSASAEISIFRLIQTVLELAVQRQTTTRITLALHAEPASLHLAIIDDGLSQPAQLRATQSMQLIQERFNELGGLIHYDGSADTSGLKVSASVPL